MASSQPHGMNRKRPQKSRSRTRCLRINQFLGPARNHLACAFQIQRPHLEMHLGIHVVEAKTKGGNDGDPLLNGEANESAA
eukprot:CAMPEP_0175879710 /NCGR_PEP_ID=MMETSP0107_2-20121207/41916_1 /TAXON_ID=195067 ORGANISM="Goniomonas pacifica, Strain CCMP1869" /NCGR_SAMPLE_ID=MMETSP0107_2 /ASSEMBLY_ACC=CAM_ASM_000203 /LENGTH=80 /DNA_ID=CAMNT_0017199379 /DNA_START=161 /DNA_END=403 /DNA_ORIENTATION=+